MINIIFYNILQHLRLQNSIKKKENLKESVYYQNDFD